MVVVNPSSGHLSSISNTLPFKQMNLYSKSSNKLKKPNVIINHPCCIYVNDQAKFNETRHILYAIIISLWLSLIKWEWLLANILSWWKTITLVHDQILVLFIIFHLFFFHLIANWILKPVISHEHGWVFSHLPDLASLRTTQTFPEGQHDEAGWLVAPAKDFSAQECRALSMPQMCVSSVHCSSKWPWLSHDCCDPHRRDPEENV